MERKQNQIRKIIKRNGKKCLIKLHNLKGGEFLNEQLINQIMSSNTKQQNIPLDVSFASRACLVRC